MDTSLDPTLQALLDRCASLMAVGQEDRSLPLFEQRRALLFQQTECIAYLARRVEEASRNQLTVREIMPNLLQIDTLEANNIYVAVCHISTPVGIINSPLPSLNPYVLAPGKAIGCAKVVLASSR